MADQKADNAMADYPNYITKGHDYKFELDRLKKEFGKNYKELIKRDNEWVDTLDLKDKDKTTLHLMQFNMLADGLSGVHVPENMKDAESQKKTFIDVPLDSLRFNYRGFRVLEVLREHEPDIICLQECDQFDFLAHYLGHERFSGAFCAKSKSPCPKVGATFNKKLNSDGVAIFYNSKRYECIAERKFGLKVESKQDNPHQIDIPALAMLFRDIRNKKEFIVCSAHLKSTKEKKGEIIRLGQLQHLLPKLKEFSTSNKDCNVFLCVDLNTTNHETYSVCYNSIMFPDKARKEEAADKADAKPKLAADYKDGYDGLNLFSAYYAPEINIEDVRNKKLHTQKAKNTELEYSTFKKRSGGTVKHTIDFIFHQKHKSKVMRLLALPQQSDEIPLPAYSYPSDHLCLQAVFQF